MDISYIIYYVILLILSKVENYEQYIEYKFSKCGASERCIKKIEQCRSKYSSLVKYKVCLSSSIFGESKIISELPDSIFYTYYNDFYRGDIKSTYFDFILDVLELSINDNNYNYLYEKVGNSIQINLDKIHSDVKNNIIPESIINYINNPYIYNNIMENAVYSYIANKLDEKIYVDNGYLRSVIKFSGNYNEELFYNNINEYFFNSTLTNEEVKFIIDNHNNSNLKGLFLIGLENKIENKEIDEEFIKKIKSGITKLNRLLVDYESTSIKMIVDNVMNDNKYDNNIFDLIETISKFLNMENNIKYEYTKDTNDNITLNSKKIRANSVYEGSKSIAESIYNLVFDYYDFLYNYPSNNANNTIDKATNRTIYYMDNGKMIYTSINDRVLDVMDDSNFYESIYRPLISLGEKENENEYIMESVKLMNELYYYYTSTYKLNPIEKKEINDPAEIKVEEYITDQLDIQFTENTYLELIDNENDAYYLDGLKAYISEGCPYYYDEEDINYSQVLSALRLENYYNTKYGKYLETYPVCENYAYIYEDWIETLKDVPKDNNNEYDNSIGYTPRRTTKARTTKTRTRMRTVTIKRNRRYFNN